MGNPSNEVGYEVKHQNNGAEANQKWFEDAYPPGIGRTQASRVAQMLVENRGLIGEIEKANLSVDIGPLKIGGTVDGKIGPDDITAYLKSHNDKLSTRDKDALTWLKTNWDSKEAKALREDGNGYVSVNSAAEGLLKIDSPIKGVITAEKGKGARGLTAEVGTKGAKQLAEALCALDDKCQVKPGHPSGCPCCSGGGKKDKEVEGVVRSKEPIKDKEVEGVVRNKGGEPVPDYKDLRKEPWDPKKPEEHNAQVTLEGTTYYLDKDKEDRWINYTWKDKDSGHYIGWRLNGGTGQWTLYDGDKALATAEDVRFDRSKRALVTKSMTKLQT